jgi:hypothetical protein
MKGFLRRLYAFEESDTALTALMMLKGGLLMHLSDEFAAYGRATTDIDLHTWLDITKDDLIDLFVKAGELEDRDGLRFEFGKVTDLEHVHAERPGVRVKVRAYLGDHKGGVTIDFQIDTGIGGHRPAGVRPVQLKSDFPGGPTATIYCQPWSFMVAEKLHAIVDKGLDNTRLKDYRDLFVMIDRVPYSEIVQAVADTFADRDTDIPLELADGLSDTYGETRQDDWMRFLVNSRLDGSTPTNLMFVVQELRDFYQDVFTDAAKLNPAPAYSQRMFA